MIPKAGVWIEDASLWQFDINTDEFNKIYDFDNIGGGADIIPINKQLHIIMGSCNSCHFIYDIEKSKCEINHTFKNIPPTHEPPKHSTVYFRKRKSILLFIKENKTLSSIYEYSLKNQKWNKWDISLSNKLDFANVIKTSDEKYCFIMDINNDIKILDMRTRKMLSSKVSLPRDEFKLRSNSWDSTYIRAILMADPKQNELLTSGFIKKCYKSKQFKNVMVLPYYLVKMLSEWTIIEYIHLIDNYGSQHWKIDVQHLFTKSICNTI